MFAWVGSQFDAVLATYVIGVVKALMAGIAPVAATALTLWIALYGWAVLRNEVPEPVQAFVWKLFKVGLVLAVSLQSAFYLSTVANAANGLSTGVATTFVPAAANPDEVASPYQLLDTFNDKASVLVTDLLKEAGITRVDLLLAAAVCAFANVFFLCLALFVVTLAKLVLTFVIAVGPIFVLCLAWRPTARFFDAWLSMLLNAVVLTWFSFFALGLSVFLGQAMVDAVQAGGGFDGPNLNVVAESLRYCVVMLLMGIVCFQAPSLAAALTGGPVVQQGYQMLQSAVTASSVRSVAARRSGGGSRMPGGAIQAGTGAAFVAGRAAATTVATGARAARTAAYRLASLRGRS